MSKLFEDGAYVHQHLNLGTKGKAHGRNAKASNRTCNVAKSNMWSSRFKPLALNTVSLKLAT